MSWIPSFECQGLFSPKMPNGSLSGLYDVCHTYGNLYDITNGIQGFYGKSSDEPEGAVAWAGAFGISFDKKLLSIMRNNMDGQMHEVLFSEITIPNPEGAQFYKQTLAITGVYYADPPQRYYRYIGEEVFTLDSSYCEVAVTKIDRRVYATPYSGYTSQQLTSGSVGQNFFLYVAGDKIVDEQQYFLERGLFFFSFGSYSGTENFGTGLYTQTEYYKYNATNIKKNSGAFMSLNTEYLDEVFGGDFAPEETDDPNENPDEPDDDEGGGEGDQDPTQDPIPIPPIPDVGAADAGFLTLYRMTVSEMQQFSNELVDPDAWTAIKMFFNDPMDFLGGCMLVPFIPDASGNRAYPFKSPFNVFTWASSYTIIGNEFKIINCGSMIIPEFYKSAFDANPYTKVKIFLPYIGYRDLNADEVIGRTVSVKYHCDCLTGDCVAYITRTSDYGEQVIAQHSGNCGVRVPFSRTSYDAAVAAGIQLLGGAVGMVAGGIASAAGLSGNSLSADQIASQASAATISTVNAMKQTAERSGTAGSSAGYMSLQKPHIIRTIPHQSLPSNYRRLNGYPSNIGDKLGNFSGFTAIESIKLDGIGATDAEKSEMLSLLIGGVYI